MPVDGVSPVDQMAEVSVDSKVPSLHAQTKLVSSFSFYHIYVFEPLGFHQRYNALCKDCD